MAVIVIARFYLMSGERQQGKVVSWDRKKGFGFIRRGRGRDVFVHRNDILSGDRNLEPGEKVEFEARLAPRGPAAVDVIRL